MRKATVWIVNHPVSCVVCLLLVILLLSVRITQVKINTDLSQLIPKDDPRTKYYEEFFKEAFSSDILSVVVVKPKIGDVFTHETLTLIQNLTDDFLGIDGVITVNSLTTVQQFKGEDGFLNTDQLIEDVPSDPEELLQLRDNALSNDQYIGYIVSEDGKAAGINIYTEDPAGDQTFDKRYVGAVSGIIEKHQKDYEIYHVGNPLATYTFLQYIEMDQRTVNGVMVVVFLGFLLLSYRSYLSVLLPMATTGLSLIATFGFMALMNYPITPETALVPGLLLVIGSTEDMHILSMYFLQLRNGLGKKDAVMHSAIHSALPITLTSFTTIIGFGTLVVNDTTMIKEFGIVMAFGLLVNYFVTIMTVPAILQFLKTPKNFGQTKDPEKKKILNINAVLGKIVAANKNHQSTITLITAVVVVLSLLGLFRVRVNNDFMSFFKENAPFRKDVEKLNKDLTGFSTMSIVVGTEDAGDIVEPDVLKQIDGFQQYLKNLGKFDKVVSLADYIKLMNREMNGGRKEMQSIPDTREAIAQYMMLMDYDTSSQYVDSAKKNARILLIHKMSSSYEFNMAVDEVKKYIDENITGYVKGENVKNITVTLTGLDFLIKNSVDTVVRGQVQGLGIALAVIFILMTILFMSPKGGLVAIISNTVPILINFGLMGWLAIELNTSTSMVALVALGIAIDDTIHFMVRYQNELKSTNDQKTAMANAIRTEGEPVIFTSLALAVGFGVLMLSNFVPSVYFGFLAALVMLYALLTDLFINPILLLAVQLITVWDYVTLKFKRAVLQESIILKNLRYSEAKKIILLGSIRKESAGEHIFHQGDKGEEMFLILSGSVKVFAECEGETKLLSTLEEGELFGEMALLGEGVRTASVHAETDVELLRIDYHALERVRRRNPKISAKLYMNIARILSDRVKMMNIEQLKATAG
jgi:uncharacterized protein